MMLFAISGGSNELSMNLNEGCRSPTGIIVAATIRAIAGAKRRRQSAGCPNNFHERSALGGIERSVKIMLLDFIAIPENSQVGYRPPGNHRGAGQGNVFSPAYATVRAPRAAV